MPVDVHITAYSHLCYSCAALNDTAGFWFGMACPRRPHYPLGPSPATRHPQRKDGIPVPLSERHRRNPRCADLSEQKSDLALPLTNWGGALTLSPGLRLGIDTTDPVPGGYQLWAVVVSGAISCLFLWAGFNCILIYIRRSTYIFSEAPTLDVWLGIRTCAIFFFFNFPESRHRTLSQTPFGGAMDLVRLRPLHRPP